MSNPHEERRSFSRANFFSCFWASEVKSYWCHYYCSTGWAISMCGFFQARKYISYINEMIWQSTYKARFEWLKVLVIFYFITPHSVNGNLVLHYLICLGNTIACMYNIYLCAQHHLQAKMVPASDTSCSSKVVPKV